MGKIAGMMQQVEEEQTPLQKRLEQLGKILVICCLLICAVVVVTGVWRGEEIYQMFLTGVSWRSCDTGRPSCHSDRCFGYRYKR